MKSKGMTVEELSRRAELNYNTVSGWIIHDRFPRADEALKVACTLGVSVEYLLTGNVPAPPSRAELIDSFLRQQILDRQIFLQSLMDVEGADASGKDVDG